MRVRHAISRPHACLLVTCHLKPRFPDSILPHPQHLKHAAGRILRKIHRTNCDGIAAINPAVSSRAEIARRDRAPRSRAEIARRDRAEIAPRSHRERHADEVERRWQRRLLVFIFEDEL